MSELLFGFKDLTSTESSQSIFDFGSLLFSDSYLRQFNNKRYTFYVKFIVGLANPSVLEKFFYTTANVKHYKDVLTEKVKTFGNIIKKFNENLSSDEKEKIITNLKNVLRYKYNFSEDALKNIGDTIKYGGLLRKYGGKKRYKSK